MVIFSLSQILSEAGDPGNEGRGQRAGLKTEKTEDKSICFTFNSGKIIKGQWNR